MKSIPIIFGGCVTTFWLVAFSVVFGHFYHSGADKSPWWNMDLLREPGYWLLMIVFEIFEDVLGVNDRYILAEGLPFFILGLVFTACFIGSACWFFSYFLLSRTIDWQEQYK